MYIKKEVYDFWQLMENSWSGAVATLEDIKEANKEEELMELLEEAFCGKIPTETEVNDFLWFDSDFIYEMLGMTEGGWHPICHLKKA